ncbi:MAG TPA: hypothetical protein VMA75_04170 [Candidatus Paceibacterota bacterium]|nr:hypothetical protein [Candidatus Paceibacterota bacterium]
MAKRNMIRSSGQVVRKLLLPVKKIKTIAQTANARFDRHRLEGRSFWIVDRMEDAKTLPDPQKAIILRGLRERIVKEGGMVVDTGEMIIIEAWNFDGPATPKGASYADCYTKIRIFFAGRKVSECSFFRSEDFATRKMLDDTVRKLRWKRQDHVLSVG